MRLLLLHTDEAVRGILPDLLRVWFAKSPRVSRNTVTVEDGSQLTYSRVMSLLKDEYDCILINLRLPSMLSVRISELVQLAKLPTRLVLVSGAPQDLDAALFLYDGYIRIPFYDKSAEASLEESLGGSFSPELRPARSQEHLDIAILNLLQKYETLAPASRSALHAFGLYRDVYLHRPLLGSPAGASRARIDNRLDFFGEVKPLDFSRRLRAIGESVAQSRVYLPNQKRFLACQLNFLLDTMGLTLMNFRRETEAVLEGLEQFALMARGGKCGVDPAGLRRLLLTRSAPMRYVHQGIAQIVDHLPGSSGRAAPAGVSG